ncbi:RagB/SusD family nutrient uptake outer membrane protein [Ulvibacter litoralis]|uniref:Starch-binding associating with outer membrane n=1 Tax=Ulvibacter litoralis TaxID=227084 RepID=A0A1G7EU73_9FLAO|nr:RagB/SusD family nutrient uptake outer membrane protein [Ulvibacter litoralis]GHC53944.1 membrane protein [Ulvibacter litoralis]SDE67046.1 Starch-binding associating with outer membrane [Ulvibacter litoralis]
MKKVYILLLGAILVTASCSTDLDEVPPNIASSDSLTDFEGVLNAAYYYQLGAVTPMAVMGDFRADNALMLESPYTEYDLYGPGLTAMEDQFFGPFYTALYRSILSTNNVIENSEDPVQIGEAKFLRALSYFKLVQAFGDVTVILTSPDIGDIPTFDLKRKPVNEVYNNVIIPDLQDAMSLLDNTSVNGRASRLAAQALLGKVYVHMGNFANAATQFQTFLNSAGTAGISLETEYADVFDLANIENSEIIYATQISSSVIDEYGFSEFWEWYLGQDSKSPAPLDPDLISAYDASPGDLRRAVNIDETALRSPKYPQSGGPDHDWIELRLADVILLYAEALNENGSPATTVLPLLDDIRERAGLDVLDPTIINTQTLVRKAIQDERRLELAFEGHRWFDLVRTGTVDSEMGQTINPNYYVFPIPISEVLVSNGVITQNPGY